MSVRHGASSRPTRAAGVRHGACTRRGRRGAVCALSLTAALTQACVADGPASQDDGLAATAIAAIPWPGAAEVVSVDAERAFPANLSALAYEPARGAAPAALWALMNTPTRLYRLAPSGDAWRAPAGEWTSGKPLRYPSGSGSPDAEGLALALPDPSGTRFLYVASEHANERAESRPSILRYDVTQRGASLTATHEWDLTADLPPLGVNTAIEGIAFVPDEALAALTDERTAARYDPARYADHAGGLFFVGVEQSGLVYGYALDHANARSVRVATIDTGLAGVMALEYDAGSGYLWAYCDDTCGNRAALLALDVPSAPGRFAVARLVDKPAGLPAANHEGIAITPDSACVNGQKPFFWAADGAVGGHAIRRGSVACGRSF